MSIYFLRGHQPHHFQEIPCRIERPSTLTSSDLSWEKSGIVVSNHISLESKK